MEIRFIFIRKVSFFSAVADFNVALTFNDIIY